MKPLITVPLGPFAPVGEFFYEVAADVWKTLQRERDEEQFQLGLDEIAAADPAELDTAFRQAVVEAAGTESLANQIDLVSDVTPRQDQGHRSPLVDEGQLGAGPPAPAVGVEELLQILRTGPPQRIRPVEAGKASCATMKGFCPDSASSTSETFKSRRSRRYSGTGGPWSSYQRGAANRSVTSFPHLPSFAGLVV